MSKDIKSQNSSNCMSSSQQRLVIRHRELCEIAKKWLIYSKNCGYACIEKDAGNEVADALGFRYDYSILVEAKTSRADFKKDAKKYIRNFPDGGVGDYRFYICQTGLIKPDELPKGWGLIYVNEKKKARQVVGPKGNEWLSQKEFRHTKSTKAEYNIMYSCLRN